MAFLLSVFQIGMHLIIILLVNIHLFIGILHSGEYIAVLLEEALSNGKADVFGLFRLRGIPRCHRKLRVSVKPPSSEERHPHRVRVRHLPA